MLKYELRFNLSKYLNYLNLNFANSIFVFINLYIKENCELYLPKFY